MNLSARDCLERASQGPRWENVAIGLIMFFVFLIVRVVYL